MHEPLLYAKRGEYLDTCFFGSVFLSDGNKLIQNIGENKDKICFLRSLAKPLQTSILFNSNIINDLDITDEELALFSGSHAGSIKHIKKLKQIHKKYNINYNDLLLKPLEPLDKRGFGGIKTKLHNNCSGKHTMMLLYCNYMGYGLDYTNPNHPIQSEIKKQQKELSGYDSNILTYDGCSTPLWGIPYENIINAYYKLTEKFPRLINAIIKNYYIYGGYNRLDSEIIKLGRGKLFSKVGAGGLVLVYNTANKNMLLIKMAQDNNEARRLIALHYLNKLSWINFNQNLNIYNQQDQIVAKYEFSL